MEIKGNTMVDRNLVSVIDFSKLDNSTSLESDEAQKIVGQIRKAFSETGLFFCVNHGISQEKVDQCFSAMEKFLALPKDAKAKYKAQTADDFQGYVPSGSEKFLTHVREIRDCYNISRYDYKMPEEIPEFSSVTKSIMEDFKAFALLLLKLIAAALGVEPDFFAGCHQGIFNGFNTTAFRLLHYPALPGDDEPELRITRCGEHTDFGTMTFLIQDSEGGLQGKLGDGKWYNVGHIPGAMMVIAADLLQVWSAKTFRAFPHRVQVPSDEHVRNRKRRSMAFFVHPDHDTEVRSLCSSPEENTTTYNAKEYIFNKIDNIMHANLRNV